MIDKRLVQLLDSNDVEKRKKAVMALAQTKDRDALPHLARVFKNDGSAEVRELAKKAGVYINKHAPAEPEPDLYEEEEDAYADEAEDAGYGIGYDDDYSSAEDRLYGDDDGYEDEDEEELIPLPSEIHVSDADRERARGYINSAMDYNVRGDNRKSADMVRRAFRLDPGLMHDGYSRSLASTITGLNTDEAVKLLGPSGDDLRQRTGRGSRASSTSTTLSGVFGILMITASAIALFGYFILPWINLGGTFVEEFYVSLEEELAPFASDEPRLNEVIDEFGNISYEITGLDTTLIVLNVSNTIDVMGLSRANEILTEIVGETNEVEEIQPGLADYSIPLMPLAAVVIILLSFALIRTSQISTWLLAVVIGLIGVAPLMYFYLDAVNSLLGEEADFTEFGQATLESGADLLGTGFWVSLGGMLAIVIIPFLALLTMPSAQSE